MLNDKQQKLFDAAMKSEVLCFFAVAQPLVDQLCEIIRLKEAEVQELINEVKTLEYMQSIRDDE